MSEILTLQVNEKDVPIKEFVQEILRDVILALLKNLRMVPDDIKKVTFLMK